MTSRAGRALGVGAVVVALGAVGAAVWYLLAGILGDDDDHAGAVRVLLIGDSIMNQSAPEVERTLADDDRIDRVVVRNEARNNTGLLTPGIYDWQAGAAEALADFEPHVVVVLFVGNYTSEDLWVNEGGLEVEGYTDQWFRSWDGEARRLQQQLVASGADIYWVNPPPMQGEEGRRRIDNFRLIHRRIAEGWTNTVLIDGTGVLSDEDGNFTMELPGPDGNPVEVRSPDTVHLTDDGAELLGEEIARQILPSVLVAQRLLAEEP